MPIKITPIPITDEIKLNQIFGWARNKFWESVKSRSKEIDGDYRRWVDNYAAKPQQAIRTIPYYRASNFVPQLIRMHTDLLAANNVGLLFATRPFWKPSTFSTIPGVNVLNALGEWMDNECKYNINFFEPVDLGIFLTVKTGLHVLKNCWINERRDRADADGNVKTESREGLVIDNVPFDDLFPYPVTAQFFRDCTAIFHRLRFTKEEVEFRRHLPAPFGWPAGPASAVLMGPNGTQNQSSARESLANDAGIALTPDVTRPFTVVEMWGSYELTPGKMADIVLTFNPYAGNGKDGIIRLWYNYLPSDLDPFVDLRIMPREGCIVGDCIPNILEQSQEEQAQIHNARRDANNIALVPGWKKKTSYTGANPSTEWYPGKTFEVDSMDDIMPLEFNVNYNSLIEEESALMSLAERYSGISAAKQGFGTGAVGKKGIYSSMGTLALLSEGNQRQDIYLQRLRKSFNKQGQLLFVHYRDFASKADWNIYGDNGDLLKQAFALKDSAQLRSVFFGIGASDAGANREVERQNLLLMSQTMSAYYKEIMALAPAIAGMPPGSPAQELSLQVLDSARDLANRILFAFNVYDRKKLIPDVRELLNGGKPEKQSRTLEQAGVPEAESNVSESGLQDLSRTAAQVTQAQLGGANGSARVS